MSLKKHFIYIQLKVQFVCSQSEKGHCAFPRRSFIDSRSYIARAALLIQRLASVICSLFNASAHFYLDRVMSLLTSAYNARAPLL